MKVGLVTQPRTYTGRIFFKRILRIKIKEEIKNAANPFDLVVGIVPFSEFRLEKMKRSRLETIIRKQQQYLSSCGIKKIVYSDFLKGICKEKGVLLGEVDDETGNVVFLKLAPVCVRQTAKKCGIDLMNALVCIRDVKAGRISEYLMRELCFDTKSLVLCTQNKEHAENICEEFFEETGFLVNTLDYCIPKSDICIDVDLGEISFGPDLYVRTFDMGFELNGYEVKHTEIAACLPKLCTSEIRCQYSYKK